MKFLGFQKPDEIFPKLGLTVLTSISEALPLVVLESFASGVPVVATDVGSCRELIEGRLPEDRALGAAGAVVPIAAPDEAAAAMVKLLKDPHGLVPGARGGPRSGCSTYYTREQMFDAYRGVYKTALEAAAWQGIGFELRKLMRRDSFWGLIRAYGYAGLISSGPWVLSILGVMGIGIFSVNRVASLAVRQFLVSVTYLMAGVADPDRLPAADVHPLHRRPPVRQGGGRGAAQPVRGAGADHGVGRGAVARSSCWSAFGGLPLSYRALMVIGFVTLCDLWVVVVLLSGLKAYRSVLAALRRRLRHLGGRGHAAVGARAGRPAGGLRGRAGGAAVPAAGRR